LKVLKLFLSRPRSKPRLWISRPKPRLCPRGASRPSYKTGLEDYITGPKWKPISYTFATTSVHGNLDILSQFASGVGYLNFKGRGRREQCPFPWYEFFEQAL